MLVFATVVLGLTVTMCVFSGREESQAETEA